MKKPKGGRFTRFSRKTVKPGAKMGGRNEGFGSNNSEVERIIVSRPIIHGEAVMKERRSVLLTLWRSLLLRCPVCGRSSIIERPFKIKHHCPICNSLYLREAGFFVGAILINVVTTEIVIVIIHLVAIVALGANYDLVLTVLFFSAVLFPLLFYHHSWSLWLGLDHIIESLPKNQTIGSAAVTTRQEWPDVIEP